MPTGEYRLAVQDGGKATFGFVRLLVEQSDKDCIEFDKVYAYFDWRDSLQKGVMCALHYARRHADIGNLTVRILEIGAFPTDTTEDAMKYVTAQAMYRALGIPPDPDVKFNRSNHSFTFPP